MVYALTKAGEDMRMDYYRSSTRRPKFKRSNLSPRRTYLPRVFARGGREAHPGAAAVEPQCGVEVERRDEDGLEQVVDVHAQQAQAHPPVALPALHVHASRDRGHRRERPRQDWAMLSVDSGQLLKMIHSDTLHRC